MYKRTQICSQLCRKATITGPPKGGSISIGLGEGRGRFCSCHFCEPPIAPMESGISTGF